MLFNPHQPARQLAEFIHLYLEGTCDGKPGEYALFPNGFSGIFFNFGKPGILSLKQQMRTPKVSIYGQIDRHFMISHDPGFTSIGVLFKPSALSKLLKLDMMEFANMAFDGELIVKELSELHARMEESADSGTKISLLDSFFTKAMLASDTTFGVADHALRLMELYRNIPMENLALKIGVSQRYLEKQFNKVIGLPPKTYSLIQRFKRIEHELRVSNSAYWADLEFANNYYDQNHFIKDFKRFTGRTPSNYLLEDLDMARSYLVR
ncbi:MAG: helix-turn-helix domain-containing protein [Bacteroidota bacterium]